MNINNIRTAASAVFSYRYARAFGMPLPGRSVNTAASDPFTRLSTLKRLSYDPSEGVKALVAENLAGRYSVRFDPFRIMDFDDVVVRDSFALTKSTEALLKFVMSKTFFASYAYDELGSRGLLSTANLTKLSASLHYGVLSRIASNPETSQGILMSFMRNSPFLGPIAFKNLSRRDNMVPAILRNIAYSASDEVLRCIASHKDADPDVIAFAISVSTPKSKEVVDKEEILRFVGETIRVPGIASPFHIEGKWVVDQPEETHLEYSSWDARKALQLISCHDDEKIERILCELERLNARLAWIIRKEMSVKE